MFGFNNGSSVATSDDRARQRARLRPRHLDFHPTKPWVYVSIERQNQIYLYDLQPDGTLATTPRFVKTQPARFAAMSRPSQGAGTIHVHPNGRFVYQTNRNAGVVDYQGQKVFGGGENNVAVWSIDQETGEPSFDRSGRRPRHPAAHVRRRIPRPAAGRRQHPASARPQRRRASRTLSAGLSVYRIDENSGRLTFVRKYDVDTSARHAVLERNGDAGLRAATYDAVCSRA